MIKFELLSIIDSSFTEQEIDGVPTIVFTVVPVIGIVGNTYPDFTNLRNVVTVNCLKTDTGVEMDDKIKLACQEFVTTNYPPIK